MMHDLANIEEFLKDQDQSVEFKESLAIVEETCLVEHNGSTTWKEIFLLVRNIISIFVLSTHDKFTAFICEVF